MGDITKIDGSKYRGTVDLVEGERRSDGKPNRECAKCGMVNKKKKYPACECTVFKVL